MENYIIPNEHKECLLTMLCHIHNLFKKHNIKYFIDGGTLLGAVRERGLIPYDDDVDLGVFNKQWEDMIKTLSELKDDKYEMKIEYHEGLIKVFVAGMWGKLKESNRIIGTPTIDIFRWRKSNNKIELDTISNRRQFKNCFYNKDELYPLKQYIFNGLLVYGAFNPFPYLYRYYGDDCLKVRKVEFRDTLDPKKKLITKIIN